MLTNRLVILSARAALFGAGLFGLVACAAFPTQGPNPLTVQPAEEPTQERLGYFLTDLSPAALDVLERLGPKARGGNLSRLRSSPPNLMFGVGDLVSVTIFESAAGGLFIPSEAGSRSGNFVALPAQEVDRAGMIQVPYAGAIQAAGRTPGQVKAAIEERLRNRAIEPQALVTLQESRSTLVSVAGEAATPIRFSISRSGDRVLDAIARAGGSKWPNYETYVTVVRGKQSETVYFNRLITDPASNIFIQPGDTISLSRQTRSFLALGASGQNGFVNFEAENLVLSQAVARAGGVLDARGDPGQTFIYRLESRDVARALGHDVSRFTGDRVPVIYRANLRDPQVFFLATKFPMFDKDILFVSNAASVEVSKVLQFISLASNTVSDVDTARIAIKGGNR